jgi:decaprenylphospho-beta-D-ribofuranose 2-oxidase
MIDAARTDRLLTGWGRTAPSRATVVRPADVAAIAAELVSPSPRGVLPRGLGRSYGDVAQNGGGIVLDMTGLAGVEVFDDRVGTITALAGTSLDTILRIIVPRGWFLPVTPGTRFVTLGGAIANDVHGKNHHVDGGIGDHVSAFDLVTADGIERSVTSTSDPETFAATVGGMGLTGVITRATLRLLPIETSRVRVDTERAADLDDLMARMTSGDDRYRYSVAWVDGLARGRALGRSVLTRGDHATLEELGDRWSGDALAFDPRTLPSVPAVMPNVVTPITARVFNELWFRKAPLHELGRIVPMAPFFYPLDAVGDWNRLYGSRGFVQYQFVVRFGEESTVRDAIERLAASGSASFLAVLKRFGPGRGMLSFPIEGWTLALDIPARRGHLSELLDGLDHRVADAGGRVYLAKDARLDPGLLAAMYPELAQAEAIRSALDPANVFRSDLARRLGIGAPTRRVVHA